MHRLLGELLDERGEYGRAFAQHRQANHLRPAHYDPAGHEALLRRLAETVDRELLDNLPFRLAVYDVAGRLLARIDEAVRHAIGAGDSAAAAAIVERSSVGW